MGVAALLSHAESFMYAFKVLPAVIEAGSPVLQQGTCGLGRGNVVRKHVQVFFYGNMCFSLFLLWQNLSWQQHPFAK